MWRFNLMLRRSIRAISNFRSRLSRHLPPRVESEDLSPRDSQTLLTHALRSSFGHRLSVAGNQHKQNRILESHFPRPGFSNASLKTEYEYFRPDRTGTTQNTKRTSATKFRGERHHRGHVGRPLALSPYLWVAEHGAVNKLFPANLPPFICLENRRHHSLHPPSCTVPPIRKIQEAKKKMFFSAAANLSGIRVSIETKQLAPIKTEAGWRIFASVSPRNCIKSARNGVKNVAF